MYYTYCPDCGYQDTHDYSIPSKEVDRTVPSPLNGNPITYVKECYGCKGKNCGDTIMSEDTMEMKVFLRSAIHYHINSPALRPTKSE